MRKGHGACPQRPICNSSFEESSTIIFQFVVPVSGRSGPLHLLGHGFPSKPTPFIHAKNGDKGSQKRPLVKPWSLRVPKNHTQNAEHVEPRAPVLFFFPPVPTRVETHPSLLCAKAPCSLFEKAASQNVEKKHAGSFLVAKSNNSFSNCECTKSCSW